MAIITMMALVSFFSVQAIVQKNPLVISGRVISQEESSPLEGATIFVKGTTNITGTMPDGAFSLSAAPKDTVVISLSGYKTKEIVVTSNTYYEVVLKQADEPSFLNANAGPVVALAFGFGD